MNHHHRNCQHQEKIWNSTTPATASSLTVPQYSCTTRPLHTGICNDTDQDVPEYTVPEETTVLTADFELYGGEGAITLVSNIPVRGVAVDDHSNICYVRASAAREANKTCHTSSTFRWHFLEQSAVLLQPLPLSFSRARICTDALTDKLFDNQPHQSQSRQRVMRTKEALLPRSIPIMPTLALPLG